MNLRNIPFSPPDIGEQEIEAVAKVLRSGWITTGPETKRFEKMIADYCKTEKAVCLNSATASLELNLRVLGVGEGDEVIVPAYTYTASVSAAVHVGAKPIFVDSQCGSFEMDYDKMENALTEKTKAVIAVDFGGVICDYDRIYRAVENKRNLFTPSGKIQQAFGRVAVIADGAHSLGAERNGKKAGAIADFTSFSFHAVKNLTTAEGGAATWKNIEGIDNDELYKSYQLYSLHGQSKDALAKTKAGAWEYDVIGPWYKCNMTDIMAAIGICQLERYERLLERRKEIILTYNSVLDKLGVEHLNHYGDNYSSSGHLYITRVPNINCEQRNEIITEMSQRGISCNVHYKPLPMMTAYKNMGLNIADYPNAYDFFANEITLPLHTKLTDEDVEYVIGNYKEAVQKYL